MMKRTTQWLALWLSICLLVTACGNASSFMKDNYTLIDVQGQGNSISRIYAVEGKDVPATAKELAAQEKPDEVSKESQETMFLVYSDKLVQVQQDPDNEDVTLVEVSTVEYASQHYSPSFLEGYLAASILHSMFGNGWTGRSDGDYRGYTSSKRYDDYGKYQSKTGTAVKPPSQQAPTTSQRQGSFTTSGTQKSTKSGTSTIRRNDGSTPKKMTVPKTTRRVGSFKRR